MNSSRRAMLGWVASLVAAPAFGAGRPGDDLVRGALDEAAALPAAEGLARLRGVRAATPRDRLDLEAARSGLRIAAAQAARFPPAAAQRAALTALRDAGTPGALRLRDGAAWLRLELRRQVGDAVTVEGAATRVAAERRHVEARAQRLFDAIDVPAGSTGARYAALWRDERYLFADDEAGRAAAVAAMTATLATLRPHVARACGVAVPPCTVRALSAAEMAAGKGGFRTLPTGDAPGVYAVDLKDVRRRPAWTLPSVVAHELVPGHMLQLPVEALAPPHALRVAATTGFGEGWGIHAETLAAGWGAYADPRAMLGHLHWLLFRLGRAEVDLGIHAQGWTLAQARAKLVTWQGEPAYFAPFDTDLARIAIEPGARAAEAWAWLGIADAARRAGARPDFYRALLVGGRRRLEQL